VARSIFSLQTENPNMVFNATQGRIVFLFKEKKKEEEKPRQ